MQAHLSVAQPQTAELQRIPFRRQPQPGRQAGWDPRVVPYATTWSLFDPIFLSVIFFAQVD